MPAHRSTMNGAAMQSTSSLAKSQVLPKIQSAGMLI